MEKKNMLPKYSRGEELCNSITHAIGAVIGVVGTIILLLVIKQYDDKLATISVLIYGVSMILLYSMSTIYHFVTKVNLKEKLQICDHCSIFILIAGTYTPFMFIILRGSLGYTIGIAVWVVAIIGIILNIIDLHKYEKVSMLCYIAMGWAILIAIKPLVNSLNPMALKLLIAGGLSYTIGILFYAMKTRPYMHSIWHLFVLGGTITHYISVLISIL